LFLEIAQKINFQQASMIHLNSLSAAEVHVPSKIIDNCCDNCLSEYLDTMIMTDYWTIVSIQKW